ncbi:hypothetical protein J1614_002828 [Plenodomus biglobosus]|nr:hypothetical protein J1614_002828 [Plenodomus biglobosus]
MTEGCRLTVDHLHDARTPVGRVGGGASACRAEEGKSRPSLRVRLVQAAANKEPHRPPATETPQPHSPAWPAVPLCAPVATMMEPPAKRLRILQTVEVDEENEDYINAKKAQEKRLRSRLESIFAKYENMHESNSDIIDMKANKVVVDRGHLRRLQRQATRTEPSLLDTLGYSVSREEDEPPAGEDVDSRDESEDELAPTQPLKATRAEVADRSATLQPVQTPVAANLQPSPHQNPYTPGPAANLLQYVQFPQTPAGQQAQTAFYATLTQTINQAVQQAVAPLFSRILSSTPSLQHAAVQAPLPLCATPSLGADTVAPATDPKWSFPPLPAKTPSAHITQSMQLPNSAKPKSPIVTKEVDETTFPAIPAKQSEPQQLADGQSITHRYEADSIAAPCSTPSRRSPRVEIPWRREEIPQRREEIPRRRNLVSKYQFSKEDDVHISKKKLLEGYSWAQIRDSRKRWKQWPLRPFHNHWTKLRRQNLHLQVASQETAQNESQELPSLLHHLPTPSSSRHEDHVDETFETCPPQGPDLVSSNISHYDNEELELLSIAGDDHSDLPEISHDDELQQDVVLPSIETPPVLTEEDIIQQELVQNSPTIEPPNILDRTREPTTNNAKKRRHSLDSQQSIPDSEADPEDRLAHTSTDIFTHAQPPNTPKRRNPRKSTSIDLVGDDDELLAPVTPRIKREPSTPLPMSFLCSTPAPITPTFALSQSTSKLSHNTFRKHVKQSWTKRGTPGAKSLGGSLAKRRSFPGMKRGFGGKRGGGWDAEESEDELGM